MARLARKISESGIYHIVFRSINKQLIFEENNDYIKLKDILSTLKVEMHFEIYAYCFMGNHVHLLLKENNWGDISLIMKRELTKYVRWYNTKYQRSGALIANRFKSLPVNVDEYFLNLIRYIHQNPLKAGIVKNISDYNWSSYNEYVNIITGLANKNFLLKMISLNDFITFHETEENSVFLVDDKIKITDDEIKKRIKKIHKIDPNQICHLSKEERNCLLAKLKTEYSIRQLERITGISRGIIQKC
jgi:REP element-mobilizing transposase RayT